MGDTLYAGTHDARLFRIRTDGGIESLPGFDAAEGRETWYAGTAVVDGEVVGPPLGVRSLTATADGRALLANVHVGGIPRSTDGGATWRATIAVDADVHEVRAHRRRPNVVAAASAVGLCLSRDGGATWTIEREGLHAPYCSAVAFIGDDVLVAAAEHHFAAEGAIYRRTIEARAPLAPVRGGLPAWTDGIVDTHCIASRGSDVVVADRHGNVHVSADGGRTWHRQAEVIPGPSALLLI